MNRIDITEWIKIQFKPLILSIPDDVIDQKIKDAIRYWNTHSAFKIIVMADMPAPNSSVSMPTSVKTVSEVIPNALESVVLDQFPFWSFFGNVNSGTFVQDYTELFEGYKSYKKYYSSEMAWTWVRSTDSEDVGGKLYVTRYPAGATKLACMCLKRITLNEDVKDEHILDWLLNYTLALIKIIEGNVLRKGQLIGIKDDGNNLLSEGAKEKEQLEETLRKEGRWFIMAKVL